MELIRVRVANALETKQKDKNNASKPLPTLPVMILSSSRERGRRLGNPPTIRVTRQRSVVNPLTRNPIALVGER